MFGPSILVTPVTEPGVKQWSLYLPKQENGWIDFRSGVKFEGGRILDVPVDLTAIPLFVRAGSIIPMGPAKQFTSQSSGEPMEIRIYPGADASFTLYEDEGDNYQYEKGIFSSIEMKWDDAAATLTIGTRKGTFPGMEKSRTFRLLVVKPRTEKNETVTINYNGKRKEITLLDKKER